MEGPRGVKITELDSLRQLTGVVFREGLVDEYPQLFNEDNLDNLLVMLDNGLVVSHVGMTEQLATIFGCQVKVACIGAVSTYTEYRGQGLATKLFDYACDKAFADGVDFMIISGDRGLYRRAACREVGSDFSATVTSEQFPNLSPSELTVEPCTEKDLKSIATIHRTEPVRFLRRREDYERAFSCKVVMNRKSDFLLVKKGSLPRAYLILQLPRQSRETVSVAEYAGERFSFVAALPQVLKLYKLEGVMIHVLGYDLLLKTLLEEKDTKLQTANSSGTVRIINFQQFMERMRPYFQEKIGYKRAAELRFSDDGENFCISCGSDQLVLSDRGDLAHLLFGTREPMNEDWLARKGRLTEILREILPIPALWYGINYV